MNKEKSVISDLKYSLNKVEQAKPIIRHLLGGGEIQTVEGRDDEICLMLDRNCGIDYFQMYDNGITWGIGSRFQKIYPGKFPYNTFTVRKDRQSNERTEFEKKEIAIKRNGIYPYLSLQGYYDAITGEMISLAIAKTKDIMEIIKIGYYRILRTGTSQIGQAFFFYTVDWYAVKKMGYPIKIWSLEEE